MDWLNWELISSIVGWIVGLVGIAIITQLWKTIKRGYSVYNTYYKFKKSGWTNTEKDKFIEKVADFFQSVTSLWNTIFNKKK